MDAVADQVPESGSYSSEEASSTSVLPTPPAARTRPSASKVAVCSILASNKLPGATAEPLRGSDSTMEDGELSDSGDSEWPPQPTMKRIIRTVRTINPKRALSTVMAVHFG